jgi:tRNA 2-thiouridine synthesizing protein A
MASEPEGEARATLDAVGLLCPAPIMKTAEKMHELRLGRVLEVISDDPGIEADLPAWCKSTGNEFLGIEKRGVHYHALIRKGRRTG